MCVHPYLFEVFMGWYVCEAVVVEEAHFLVEQAVDHMSPGVLPLHQTHQATVQGPAQIHRPVIRIQGHLENEGGREREREKQSNRKREGERKRGE